MSQSLRNDFHTDIASTVLADIQYHRSNYFSFIGKTEEWGVSDLPPGTTQINSTYEDNLIRTNSLYYKKVTPNDVSLVTKRYDWTSGLVYDKWDHTLDMKSKRFYCMTDEFNVYKCLDNYGGVASTVKPTGTSYHPITTADGYIWKYMYSVPGFKKTRFASLTYIPVQTALSDSFYNKGAIETVTITNGGTGYTDTLLTTVSVSGGSVTGAGANIGIIVNPSTGAITGVSVVSGGTGYTHGAIVTVNSATGFGAHLEIVASGGIITGMTIVAAGIGYLATDTISVTVGGASIIPVVSRTTHSIVDIIINSAGAGYTVAPTLTVNSAMPGASGAYGSNLTAILEAIVDQGKIVQVLIRDPGVNYPVDSATTITVAGDGTGAVFSPVVYNGSVVDIIIENAGTAYTFIDLTIVGPGVGATAIGYIGGSDYQSDQNVIEQTTVAGAIHAVHVSTSGTNYSNATYLTVTGDGTGAVATPIIINGAIVRVQMNSVGSGYNYASITLTDPQRGSAPLGSVDAVMYPILPPRGGHGKNAVSELYGDTLAINTVLRDEPDLEILKFIQEYRQYGMIKNPSFVSSGKTYTGTKELVAYEMLLNTVTGIIEDEILVSGPVKFRVTSVDSVTNIVTLQKLGNGSNYTNTLIKESNPGVSYYIISFQRYPEIDKYSGELLYISNEVPFIIGDNKSIISKTFLKF